MIIRDIVLSFFLRFKLPPKISRSSFCYTYRFNRSRRTNLQLTGCVATFITLLFNFAYIWCGNKLWNHAGTVYDRREFIPRFAWIGLNRRINSKDWLFLFILKISLSYSKQIHVKFILEYIICKNCNYRLTVNSVS